MLDGRSGLGYPNRALLSSVIVSRWPEVTFAMQCDIRLICQVELDSSGQTPLFILAPSLRA